MQEAEDFGFDKHSLYSRQGRDQANTVDVCWSAAVWYLFVAIIHFTALPMYACKAARHVKSSCSTAVHWLAYTALNI
jgi:hypothetical protein